MMSCERTELMDPEETVGIDPWHLPSALDSDAPDDPFFPMLPEWMCVGGK
jgi:hypothetical protein